MKIILKSYFILLFSTSAIAAEPHDHEAKMRAFATVPPVEPVVEQIEKLNCKPSELKKYLQDRLVEDEQHATAELDEYIRKVFKFDKQELVPSERRNMLRMAAQGLRQIDGRYENRWQRVMEKLTGKSAVFKGPIAKQKDKVREEYQKLCKLWEAEAQERNENKDAPPKVVFTGVPCVACAVGYAPLNTALNQLRKTKRLEGCPETEEEPAKVEVTPEGKEGIDEMLAYIAKGGDEAHLRFANALTYLNFLNESRPDQAQKMVNYVEGMYKDAKRTDEKTALLKAFGIPPQAIVAVRNPQNGFAAGVNVDYSQFSNSSVRRKNDSQSPYIINIYKSLGKVGNKEIGPKTPGNLFLKEITGACFYCDARQWGILTFAPPN